MNLIATNYKKIGKKFNAAYKNRMAKKLVRRDKNIDKY